MRAFWKLTVAEFKLFIREPLAVFFILAFPLILLWLNGSQGGRIDRLLPGYVALILATVGLTQLPSVLATYRERGILRRLATTPVPWQPSSARSWSSTSPPAPSASRCCSRWPAPSTTFPSRGRSRRRSSST